MANPASGQKGMMQSVDGSLDFVTFKYLGATDSEKHGQ